MEKISLSATAVVEDEQYEMEFVYDPAYVYLPGEYADPKDFIEDYCSVCPADMADTVQWMRSITIPEAVKFCAEAWGIAYRLRKTTTVEEYL